MTPVLPIPAVLGHTPDPVAAYKALLAASPTTHPNQPLLTVTKSLRQTSHNHLALKALKLLLHAGFAQGPSTFLPSQPQKWGRYVCIQSQHKSVAHIASWT